MFSSEYILLLLRTPHIVFTLTILTDHKQSYKERLSINNTDINRYVLTDID